MIIQPNEKHELGTKASISVPEATDDHHTTFRTEKQATKASVRLYRCYIDGQYSTSKLS